MALVGEAMPEISVFIERPSSFFIDQHSARRNMCGKVWVFVTSVDPSHLLAATAGASERPPRRVASEESV